MSNSKDFKVKNGIQPTVYHEAVGTVTFGSEYYSLTGASYDNKSFNRTSQGSGQVGIYIKSDGTKLYSCSFSTGAVYQYSLSTAWDVSTASYDSKSFSVSSQEASSYDVTFKSDGTKMYIVGIGNDTVYQYTLSTAWDVSTASYDSVSFSVASQETTPVGINFKSDGTSMYIVGVATDNVYQYALSTAWDLSTASYASKSYSLTTGGETAPYSIVFNADGSKLFNVGVNTGSIYQHSLSTAWDVSTASYDSVSFSVPTGNPYGIFIKGDGTKLYISDTTDQTVYQYSTSLTTNTLDLSTGSVFEITPTSDIKIALSNPADSGTVSAATLLLDGAATVTYDIANGAYDSKSYSAAPTVDNGFAVRFKTDGTKMYLYNQSDRKIHQYSVSTAWDVSTVSYDSVAYDVTTQSSTARDIFFKPDGTKMFVLRDAASDNVLEYALSTAWDVSTASYTAASTNVGGDSYGLIFKPDGTKMYVATPSLGVREYSLSTAWSVSSASLTDTTTFTEVASPGIIDFNADGTKLYVSQLGSQATVYQYSLSTAYDVSTKSYDSVSFAINDQETSSVYTFVFGNSGVNMYVFGNGFNTVYQYSTATPATITYDTSLEFAGGTAPTSPAIGETDVITISTRDGGTTYQAVQAIDGAK